MCEFLWNPWYLEFPGGSDTDSSFFCDPEIGELHASLPGYAPTPLVGLPALAARLGLSSVDVKDESQRFGIKAFKPLGASYSIFRYLKSVWNSRYSGSLNVGSFLSPEVRKQMAEYTFTAATDGNHGRAVAWTARILGAGAVIYMPADSAPARVQNIRNEGAEVVLVPGVFDLCVERADADARKYGRVVISDTAYPGYMEFPKYIMAGYSTIFNEIASQKNLKNECPWDLVILQAGVGGLAAAGCSFFRSFYGSSAPDIVCLEPVNADSFMESARQGKPVPSTKAYNSVMAGLNCGVSLLAWPVVRDGVKAFVSISDRYVPEAMRLYGCPLPGDAAVISGESGASGLAGLLALLRDEALAEARQRLNITPDSRVLLINTEGDTDPVNYRKIMDA